MPFICFCGKILSVTRVNISQRIMFWLDTDPENKTYFVSHTVSLYVMIFEINKQKGAKELKFLHVGFEVLTAVVMKTFWDITPCSQLNVDQHFGGTYRFHLQSQRISQARNQRETVRILTCCCAGLVLFPAGVRFFSSLHPDWFWSPRTLLFNEYRGPFLQI
jgi:hypothetical protein